MMTLFWAAGLVNGITMIVRFRRSNPLFWLGLVAAVCVEFGLCGELR